MELKFVTLIYIFSSQYLDRYSVSTNLDLTFPLALSTEIKSVLDKHSIALEKQKENTTKLSKLCLGTLNELEKFEKKAEQVCLILIQFSKYIKFIQEKRETSTVPKTEDRLRRLTEENKKLIHLVTR